MSKIAIHERKNHESAVRNILETVYDPEIPVLSVMDLGIVRSIRYNDNGEWEIALTPTYSGCPAMDMIAQNILVALHTNGFHNSRIITVLSPAWTTDWMRDAAKEKLKNYGIAPPVAKLHSCAANETDEQMAIQCPLCKSYHTQLVSRFGSTACKALYKCLDCLEPFDYFKCH